MRGSFVLEGQNALKVDPGGGDDARIFHFHADERNHDDLVFLIEGEHFPSTIRTERKELRRIPADLILLV